MNDKDLEYINRITACLTENIPHESLEYYDDKIYKLNKSLEDSKNNPNIHINNQIVESELKIMTKKREQAAKALEKISTKGNDWLSTRESKISDKLYSDIWSFLKDNEFEPELKTFLKENNKINKLCDSKKEELFKTIKRNGKDVIIYQDKIVKEVKLPDINLDEEEIYKQYLINKLKKEKPKEKYEIPEPEPEKSFVDKINFIEDKNKKLTSKEKDDLEVMKTGYSRIEKRKDKIKKIENFIEQLDNKDGYDKTKVDLVKLKGKLEKEIVSINNEINKRNPDLNIDEMYNRELDLIKKQQEIEANKKELERIKDSDNYFTSSLEETQTEKLDKLYAERQEIIEERGTNDEEPNKNNIQTNTDKIAELNNMIEELGNQGYYQMKTSAFQKYAVEKVKQTELGKMTFTDYLNEKGATNLVEFQELIEERDNIIYEEFEKTGLPLNQFENYANKQYGIEGVNLPEYITNQIDNNLTR